MAVLAMAGMAFGCSSGDDDAPEEGRSTTVTTAQQEGPAAEFGEPLDGGEGVRLATAGGGPSLDDAGFTEAEYAASAPLLTLSHSTTSVPLKSSASAGRRTSTRVA